MPEFTLQLLGLAAGISFVAAYVAALIWQVWRVIHAPGLWRFNAFAVVGATSLLFLPPYEGYAALTRALNVSLLPVPFLIVSIIGDPGAYKLLPLAQIVCTALIFAALFLSAS